jgi:hypothetical protein
MIGKTNTEKCENIKIVYIFEGINMHSNRDKHHVHKTGEDRCKGIVKKHKPAWRTKIKKRTTKGCYENGF